MNGISVLGRVRIELASPLYLGDAICDLEEGSHQTLNRLATQSRTSSLQNREK